MDRRVDKQVSFRIDESMWDEVKKVAETLDRSPSHIVRDAVRQYLAKVL